MLSEQTAAPRTDGVLSPFAFAGPDLIEQGYSPLPIAPGNKIPGIFTGGEWSLLRGWQRFCLAPAPPNLVAGWSRFPGAGVGVACGRGLVLVDIDLDDAVGYVMAALPPCIVGKKGAKGLTLCFRGDTSKIRSRAFKIGGIGVVDLLADGKQSVLPPSIHPKTGKPYEWMSERTLLDTPLVELTEVPDNVADLIAEALRPLGYKPEQTFEFSGEIRESNSSATDFFRRLNEDALANLDAWVPKLGIRCQREHDGGWRAVPDWRPSSSGRPASRRGLNLSFDPRGIRDFGDGGKTYTPLNVVIAAKGYDRDAAIRWIGEALGQCFEPVITLVAGPSAPSVLARTSAALEVPNAVSDVLNRPIVAATPFRWGDPARIPRREWLYGRALIRRFMSVLVAPGGVGKSSLTIVEALAMASGRPLLGAEPVGRLRVWLWNGEDPRDELERRIAAACLHYGLDEGAIGDGLFVDSGRDTRLVVMREVRRELVVAEPVVEAVVSEIAGKRIDVMIVDPFVTTHEVAENDNGAIARVAYLWSDIANRTGCAILLVHHARKTNGGEVTAEDSRGGIALVGAARVVRVLNPMTATEADEFGVPSDERLSLVRISDGKANLSRRSDRGSWFRLTSVSLGNGSGNLDPGDEVAVAAEWAPPSKAARTALTPAELEAIKAEVAAGEHRFDERSPTWVGNAVVSALDLDPAERGTKRLVKAMIERLIAEGHLKVVEGLDASRKKKTFVEVAAVAAV
ncbi:AAA family ATPase [Methylobacterium sp. NEAU 140]|uniref:AAA family ATPase n=1 Tax=Methylobacterium sp. NEAU 140 TaxID=3064945 RepID=UPI0027332306|nr:AAA family ATPase [Methylobacterium sp. NEAU 140]MDP4022062.1 AAA family ATPase [Methylobacterium sp. NEAU 140]